MAVPVISIFSGGEYVAHVAEGARDAYVGRPGRPADRNRLRRGGAAYTPEARSRLRRCEAATEPARSPFIWPIQPTPIDISIRSTNTVSG